MLKQICKIGCLVMVIGFFSMPAWCSNTVGFISSDHPLIIAHGGNGPGDGTGNGGVGPADGSGNGPGDCGMNTSDDLRFIAFGGNAGSGDSGGNGPGDGTGNGGDGPADGTGNGPGAGAGAGNGGTGDNGGNGPGDGTGNDGDGPADGTGNGPGDCA